MSTQTTTGTAPSSAPPGPVPPEQYDWLAAGLSYLVPGLGQIVQGRVGKGVLFLVALPLLFFNGLRLGHWENVYLPSDSTATNPVSRLVTNLYSRPAFAAQFWIGVPAWPAVYEYAVADEKDRLPMDDPARGPRFTYGRAPSEARINDLQRNGSKRWDLGWVYTVIAGVLNVLVIYDALAGPAFREPPAKDKAKKET